MNAPNDHLADELLSALVDNQVDPIVREQSTAHIAACSDCELRLSQLQAVVTRLRALPSLEPTRDFRLGPRLVADPPRVVRLQRWYTVTRAAAASLAAVFVFLVAGSLYVDMTAAPRSTASLSAGAPSAPGLRDGAPAATTAPATSPTLSTAARAAAPAAAKPVPAAAPQSGDSTDQVAAATSVRPLPTPVPTPTQVVVPTPVVVRAPIEAADPGSGWRFAASAAGLLAVLVLFATVALRHRLRSARGANLPFAE